MCASLSFSSICAEEAQGSILAPLFQGFLFKQNKKTNIYARLSSSTTCSNHSPLIPPVLSLSSTRRKATQVMLMLMMLQPATRTSPSFFLPFPFTDGHSIIWPPPKTPPFPCSPPSSSTAASIQTKAFLRRCEVVVKTELPQRIYISQNTEYVCNSVHLPIITFSKF